MKPLHSADKLVRNEKMKQQITWAWLFAITVLILSASDRVDAQVINVGTQGNASNWLVTGAGASQSPAFPYGGLQQEISITDNGGQFGNFVTGGILANFGGVWYADRSFMLPHAEWNHHRQH